MTDGDKVNYKDIYENHPEYINRRQNGTFEQIRIRLEVTTYKIPGLISLLNGDWGKSPNVLEIGCATGELIGSLDTSLFNKLTGVDISEKNISTAKHNFPHVDFHVGDFRSLNLGRFDIVILSDVLEHIPDDVLFLKEASQLADVTLIKLPLEDCPQHWFRKYGPNDKSGHLRKYNLASAFNLCHQAGVKIYSHSVKWTRDSGLDATVRSERKRLTGLEYSGSITVRAFKAIVDSAFRLCPSLGRAMVSSDVFIASRLEKST